MRSFPVIVDSDASDVELVRSYTESIGKAIENPEFKAVSQVLNRDCVIRLYAGLEELLKRYDQTGGSQQ